ncbi:MAG: hypothetical protein ACTSQB_07070 [Candidatus Heimdallarchaeota archaeon]
MDDIEKTVKVLRTVMLDPTRVAIWFEILRKPKITAKKLMEIIPIQKTAMYYHLTLLEEQEVVTSETVKKQKHFRTLMNFFELYGSAKQAFKDNHREMDIFSLLVINGFIQRELNRLMKMSPEDYQRDKYPIPYAGMWFCNREKLDLAKNEFKELLNKINDIDTSEGSDTIVHTPLAYYWGILDFE